MTISVVVPTMNEEEFLPLLLDSLGRQRFPVHEIIVADGFSSDRTREIARERGCRIVDGPGHPGIGRNKGAAAAAGDTLLFLDSDVTLPPGFLRRLVRAYRKAGAVAATVTYVPQPDTFADRLIALGANIAILVMQRIQPLAAGHCIMMDRDVFNALGGFNESLKAAEDHDLVRRATSHGPFRVFSIPLGVSTRRYVNRGRLRLTVQHIGVTIRIFLGQEITRRDGSVKRVTGSWR